MVRCHPQICEQQRLAAWLYALPVRLDRHKHCIDAETGFSRRRTSRSNVVCYVVLIEDAEVAIVLRVAYRSCPGPERCRHASSPAVDPGCTRRRPGIFLWCSNKLSMNSADKQSCLLGLALPTRCPKTLASHPERQSVTDSLIHTRSIKRIGRSFLHPRGGG